MCHSLWRRWKPFSSLWQSSVAFMAGVLPTVRDVPETFLVPNVAISGERTFFRITLLKAGPPEAGREGRKGGRVISDLLSLVSSDSSQADPGALGQILLPLISNSLENLLWQQAQVWRSNSVLDQTCKESGKVTGSAGCYFCPLLCCLLSRLVF